jgi:hypothetical protein
LKKEIAMNLIRYTAACAVAIAAGTGLALAQSDFAPADQPKTIDGVETVCTGGSGDARADPKWRDYPVRFEFVGKDGQYLGDEMVTVTGNGHTVTVHCEGPWVLMKLPKGSYHVATDVADAGHKDMTIRAPGHVVMRFPDAGGQISGLERKKVAAK